MIVVDASAIVAMVVGESEREALATQLLTTEQKIVSIVSAFEAVMAVGRLTGDQANAVKVIREFLDLAEISVVPAEDELLEVLASTYRQFGKGNGHPARLNMGDCFSYATAQKFGGTLLYKGDDFAQTDLA